MVKEWCYIVLGGFRPLTCCNCCLNSSSKSDILWKPGLSTADKNILINMSGSPPFPQSQKLTVRDFIGIQEAPPKKKHKQVPLVSDDMQCFTSSKGFSLTCQREQTWGWIHHRSIIEICQQTMPTNHVVNQSWDWVNQEFLSISPHL